MFLSKIIFVWFIQLLTAVHSVNIQVIVGANNSITFSPNTVRAVPGDTVEFIFAALNHTVTSSSPLAGCRPDFRLNSGFVPVSAPPASSKAVVRGQNNIFDNVFGKQNNGLPSFKVPILDFLPRTIYCAQKTHCQLGMVMVINPTEAGPTSLAQYKSLSAQAKANIAPPEVEGGVLRNAQGAVAGWQVSRVSQ